MSEATEAVSLQSRFDQIGNQVVEANDILDRICSDDEVKGQSKDVTPTVEGAEPSAERCQRELARLLGRLANIAVRVGHL